MATWASLTPEQQADVESLANAIRGACVTFSALVNQANVIGAAWNGGISTIVGSLGSGEIIPSTSGYAGAQSLSPADVTNFAGYLIDIANSANNTTGGGYNTPFHQALRVKFCGINAAINGA